MNPLCCASDSRRRGLVRHAGLTGLDWIEVDPGQTELRIGFVGKAVDWIEPKHLRIDGGRRERGIQVTDVGFERSGEEDLDDVMVVTVDRPGDYSSYRIEVIDVDARGRPTGRTPSGFDPRYTGLDFSFKASCPIDQDPSTPPCPTPEAPAAAIDYLARDYQSFRRLMLDRMALTAPRWTERHAPDLGLTIVEAMAYAADDLSYYQDAVATEAYLDTARLRTSVRRHVRLVDYRMDEGRSAQGWVRLTLQGAESVELDPSHLLFTTELPSGTLPMVKEQDAKIGQDVVVFEPAAGTGAIELRRAHNELDFYDWSGDPGDDRKGPGAEGGPRSECCLAKGTTRATLRDPGQVPDPASKPDPAYERGNGPPRAGCEGTDEEADVETGVKEGRWHHLRLAPGDVLVLAERLGPRTGDPADADPSRRHAVRLTGVEYGWDPLNGALTVEIVWCPEDALPFPLCLSTRTEAPGCEYVGRVSVAYGNIVPVDHGRSVEDDLEAVRTAEVVEHCGEPCEPPEMSFVARRYRPRLPRGAPAFVADSRDSTGDGCGGCGSRAASRRGFSGAAVALPSIRLESRLGASGEAIAEEWMARADLLGSEGDERHFVVETDDEGGASLRFGNGAAGMAPEAGERFRAFYRIGGGARGNIGADSLRHVVFRNAFPEGLEIEVGNPLPMRGGREPETSASARLRAPSGFRRRLERAITADDYATIVMRDFPALVQRAAATLRSSGIRTEVQVAIDPVGRAEPSEDLLACIESHLERYRQIERDVRVIPARQVPIDLEVELCVASGVIGEDVAERVRVRLGSGPGGFFHPDSLTFGGGIAVSRLIAAAHSVAGVADVRVTILNRLYEPPDGEIEAGLLPIAPTEIARLDQDRDAPWNGRLNLVVKGGR